MIRERVNAALPRAKAQGKMLGRPKIDAATERAIADALKAGGASIQKVAKTQGVMAALVP